MSPRIAGVLVLAVMLSLWPVTALAHAFPVSEEPLVDSTVYPPPNSVAITFNSPIEALFARLRVLDSKGQDEAAGPPRVDASRRRLSVPLKPLRPGGFTVKWSVVSEDGHRTEGYYNFTLAPESR